MRSLGWLTSIVEPKGSTPLQGKILGTSIHVSSSQPVFLTSIIMLELGYRSVEGCLRASRLEFSSRQSQWWNLFSLPPHSDRLWGPHSLLSKGCRGSYPGVKRQGREADYSPPSSAEAKDTWSCTSTPHIYEVWLWSSRQGLLYLYTHSWLRGVTFEVLPLTSYALTQRCCHCWNIFGNPVVE